MNAFLPPDTHAISASALLAHYNKTAQLEAADLHPVLTAARLLGETNDAVLVAAAAALRATRMGSICTAINTLPDEFDQLPPAAELISALQASPLVSCDAQESANQRPFRLDGTLLYAQRFWLDQESVRSVLLTRRAAPPPVVDEALLARAVVEVFGESNSAANLDAKTAVINAVRSWTSVIAGGPGTGKTAIVGKLLQVLAMLTERELSVALAAPTGKAAGRLQTMVSGIEPPDDFSVHPQETLHDSHLPQQQRSITQRFPKLHITTGTLHRILGSRGLGHGFRHNSVDPLPYDLLVVDEMSMVSLPLTAALLCALPASTRLVLLGDPDQLASVEAGAVLADIVDSGLSASSSSSRPLVTQLSHVWRYGGAIATLATAIKTGDADLAIATLRSAAPEVQFIEIDAALAATATHNSRHYAALAPLFDTVTAQCRVLFAAASQGDAITATAALDQHRLLTAHRDGSSGVSSWQRRLENHLKATIPGYGSAGLWHLASPILVTSNVADLGIYNGDQGVVIATANGYQVAFSTGDGIRLIPPAALPKIQSAQALTIHKAQGSQFDEVSIVLYEDSRLLTRQLLYTAVTRARHKVRLIGTTSALRRAINTVALRASGLATRLRGA
ncbi:MAG: exodeoxyribonuclease V subunit alpha [Propionibacteriaceae bacterium]|nr:exodeoxyribonuclease V subunit alpha [Propionibacteriaceae bacterium]